MSDPIISTPETNQSEVKEQYDDFAFGFSLLKGPKESQEDALCFQELTSQDITPVGEEIPLSPQELGDRLWTTLKSVNEQCKDDEGLVGAVATSTVYDGKGNLITATLGDCLSFLVLYSPDGELLKTIRLNSTIHHAKNRSEFQRIREAQGFVVQNRVMSNSHPITGKSVYAENSRAIGDSNYPGIVSDATVDIHDIHTLLLKEGIKPEEVGIKQLLTCSDGLLQQAKSQDKLGHEAYLTKIFDTQKGIGIGVYSEDDIAEFLGQQALGYGSEDNIGISITTLGETAKVSSTFDGHNGAAVAHFAATHFCPTFSQQCHMSRADYEKQLFSVSNNRDIYLRDHPGEEGRFPLIDDKEAKIQRSSSSPVMFKTIQTDKDEVTKVLASETQNKI